jgi:hypothetical protein
VRLSVGAAKPAGPRGAATGAALLATGRLARDRVAGEGLPLAARRFAAAVGDCTTTGSSDWLGRGLCAQPAAGTSRQENATEYSQEWHRLDAERTEIMIDSRLRGTSPRTRSIHASEEIRLDTHQDTPPNALRV